MDGRSETGGGEMKEGETGTGDAEDATVEIGDVSVDRLVRCVGDFEERAGRAGVGPAATPVSVAVDSTVEVEAAGGLVESARGGDEAADRGGEEVDCVPECAITTAPG